MKHDHLHDPDSDFVVEITSLDIPDMPVHTPSSFMRIPKIRAWLTALSIATGIILLIVVLSTILPTLTLPTSSPANPHTPTTNAVDINVLNGVAYVLLSDKTVHALRTRDGFQLWQYKPPALARSVSINSVNNILYMSYLEGNAIFVQALRIKDGASLWVSKAAPANSALLVVNNGISYLLSGLLMQSYTLVALNSNNGLTLWQYTLSSQIYLGSSTLLQVDQDKIYITTLLVSGGQVLFVLSNRDGSLLWRYDYTVGQQIKAPGSPLIIHNNMIYLTTSDGSVNVLRTSDGHEVWKYAPGIHVLGNIDVESTIATSIENGTLKVLQARDGALLWTYKNSIGVFNVLLVDGGVMYIATNDGSIVALRMKDGTQLWQTKPVKPSFVVIESIWVADGNLYIPAITSLVTQEIGLYALRTSDGALLWQHDMRSSDMEPLQIGNGLVFASTAGTTSLAVLRARDGTVLWHANITAFAQNNSVGASVIAGDVIFLRSVTGILEAHRVANGTLLWHYP